MGNVDSYVEVKPCMVTAVVWTGDHLTEGLPWLPRWTWYYKWVLGNMY